MFFRKRASPEKLSDAQLIERYKSSLDKYYIGELYKKYTHLVFGICLKYLKNEDESKDATMVIFEKLMDDLLKHEVNNFKGWLHMVTKNHCLMNLRKNNPLSFVEQIEDKDLYHVELARNMHQEDDTYSSLDGLNEALAVLNVEQKVCVELFYLKEKCYQQIALETGFSLNQVKSYIQNGKRNLKNYLTEKHAEGK